jgi:hypothetical protein
MNAKTYNPEPGSPEARVLGLLARNPDEGYTNQDLALKFQVRATVWAATLAKAKSLDLVCFSDSGSDAAKVWSAGPALAAWHAARSAPAAANAAPVRRKRGGVQAPLPALDISSLQVDVGLPVPEAGKGCSKWLNLLSLLKEPGHSVPLPKEYRGALYAFIKKTKAASDLQGTYIVRPDAKDATKCRVHRTA